MRGPCSTPSNEWQLGARADEEPDRLREMEARGRLLDIIIPEGLRERHWHGYRATMRTGQSRYDDGEILSVPAVRKDGWSRSSSPLYHSPTMPGG